jgi:hypothetical protein
MVICRVKGGFHFFELGYECSLGDRILIIDNKPKRIVPVSAVYSLCAEIECAVG